MVFAMATRCRSSKSLNLNVNLNLNLNRLLLYSIAAFLIFTLQLTPSSAQSQPRLSRRPAAKTAADETSERAIVPDQLALAAGRSDGQGRNGGYQRRGSVVHPRTKEPNSDYNYGQLELNLIRPEHETSSLPPHGKINGYYGVGSLSTTVESTGAVGNKNHNHNGEMSHEKALDESETAEEYVANAMKLAYGTRHKEQQPRQRPVAVTQRPYKTSSSTEHQQQQEQLKQQQQQQQEQLKQVQAQAQAALLEAQMQAELQAQLVEQQALLLAEQRQQQQLQQQQQQQQQQQVTANDNTPAPPAPVYEKETVPRSYEIYEAATQAEPAGSDNERLYRTKYYSYAAPQPYRSIEAEAEEKVRVSASTEIPKAEIMKQIEKSVIKYMKELEAEGKIITTPQELAPPATKTYYKLLSSQSGHNSGEEKRYSSSTVRPKYSSVPAAPQGRQPVQSSQQYHQQQQQQQGQHQQQVQQVQQQSHLHHSLKSNPHKPQRYQSETETAYQAPELASDSLAPNVEFIYKIKTRAPLQTATVKTVSKPYTLPLKSSAEHFDHGAAMKNIEEFDLSHVVTTPERELELEHEQRVTSKPQKLYFNSEIYHDINSLPYKGEKLRGIVAGQLHGVPANEYRHKLKAAGELHPDYKGYPGYFAEPVSSSMEIAEKQPPPSGLGSEESEEGYPIPYQYVLKKEPLSSKYEEERESWETLRLAHGKPRGGIGAGGGVGGASLDYDSYSPKFNNNPEGYGYQHTYKSQLLRGQSSGAGSAVKRGKRGGAAHPSSAGGKKLLRGGATGVSTSLGVGGKHIKDLEANLALRPPPKN